MKDVLTPSQRSYCMSQIRGKNTKPELAVRQGLFARGFRYRLHVREMPGCPDLVLPKYRAVIFVHGCLWHRHECRLFQWPQTRARFWRAKIMRNAANDKRNISRLRAAGWRVLTVWECSIRRKSAATTESAIARIAGWLRSLPT